ncbi:elongator complex protein 4 isoform X2 [Hydra vulgaris]|uniref:Elongator complex protein 4 n=1 Tax=Hydra vulgaris TaxID=6087 RepID=A0ABM4BF26_HYDVU
MSTSFVKKTTRGRTNLPAGTKVSLHNSQLLISTGVPSLDTFIGGGLAVGTLILVEEDIHSTYSNILLKYFIAEAIVVHQQVFLASSEKTPENILKEIPDLTDEDSDLKSSNDNNSDLLIAWRYKDSPKVQPVVSNLRFGHYFDLSKKISQEKIDTCKISHFCANPNRYNSNIDQYKELLESIKNELERLKTSNSMCNPSVLRICINSLGSPLWGSFSTASGACKSSLTWFLLALRSILRNSLATCMITIPTHLCEELWFVNRIRRCCDTVIQLVSFNDAVKDQNLMYKDYNGLLHVKKLAHLNCISGYDINTSDLAFKLKRKRFSIEKLHLPPNISETANRSETKPNIKTSICSSTTHANNPLDF